MKNGVLNIRIDSELKMKAQARAEAENRSLSNWLENLIRRELAKPDELKKG